MVIARKRYNTLAGTVTCKGVKYFVFKDEKEREYFVIEAKSDAPPVLCPRTAYGPFDDWSEVRGWCRDRDEIVRL